MKRLMMVLVSALAAGAPLAARAQTLPARDPVHLTFDVARFRGADDSTSLVEVHYAVNRDGLTVSRDSTGWTGGADITVLGRAHDTLAFGDRWLVPARLADTAGEARGMNLVGVYQVQLRKGNYTLKMICRDRLAPSRSDSVVAPLVVVPPAADRVALSDIEFAASIRQGGKGGPFFKNTLEVIPDVGGLYNETQLCFFYLEVYNLLLGEDRSDYAVHTVVYDAVGKEIVTRERQRRRAAESTVLVDQIPAARFRSGTYSLVVSLTDSAKRVMAQTSRKFFVFNQTLGVDSTLLTLGSSLPMAVYATMEEPELDRDFRWSRYELTDAEQAQYKQLNGLDVKRKFLSDIWRRRPPGAREVYMARVEHANENYGMLGREGYRTDRGRVYIVYGPPDDIERHPNESDTKPYEVWTYNNIQGGVEFDFLQRIQGADYELVNSTHRNELHDANWMQYAQQSN
ncbi:MAG TPA: GWxTD domain-containing protein [Bacteroidota bacterium]|nr:GWxTD domain-containing protein [Bacteroidota bacterium]